MEITKNLSSGYIILLFFLSTAGIFIIFYLLRISIPMIYPGKINVRRYRKYFTIIEGLSWGLFLLSSALFFLKNNIIFSALLFLFILLMFYWYTRFALRDCVAGIIFKSDNRFSVGDNIEVDELKGEIMRFNYRNIDIENESGRRILIPYSMLLGIVSSPQKISETVLSFSFEISIPAELPFDKVVELLKKYIYSLPWTVLKNEPKIQLIKAIDKQFIVKITLFSFDEVYFQSMRQRIESFVLHNL